MGFFLYCCPNCDPDQSQFFFLLLFPLSDGEKRRRSLEGKKDKLTDIKYELWDWSLSFDFALFSLCETLINETKV